MTRLVRLGVAAALVVLLSPRAAFTVAAAAQQASTPTAKPFPPEELGLLEAPDREQWQKPDQIMDALGIADGLSVADLGAGGGWFTSRLARRVGPNGRVYAEDIQRPMLEALGRRMQREGLSNVIPVLGTLTDPTLPTGLDAVLIVSAFHEFGDPVALLGNVRASLKPDGKLGVVDFTAGDGGPGPSADQRVAPEAVVAAATAAGFRLLSRHPIAPFQFLLEFDKAPASRKGS